MRGQSGFCSPASHRTRSIRRMPSIITSLLLIVVSQWRITQAACTNSVMDIAFLLDGSGSVGSTNYHYQTQFVIDVVKQLELGSTKTRVSLMEFSTSAVIEYEWLTDLTTITNKGQHSVPANEGTQAGVALQKAHDSLFCSSREAAFKVVVFVTDGVSADDPATYATKMRDLNTFFIAVGKSGANIAQLTSMQPSATYRHIVAAFKDIPGLATTVASQICEYGSVGTGLKYPICACKSGYHLDSASNSCKLNECTCKNGLGATETNCPTHATAKCVGCTSSLRFKLNNNECHTTCVNGWTLEVDKCVEMLCQCVHGTGASANECSATNTHKCVACARGYHLDNNACVINTCTCTNGSPPTGTNCTTHNGHTCISCTNNFKLSTDTSKKCDTCIAGYHLESGKCVENICTCTDGTGEKGATCPEHNKETCKICNTGYHLSKLKTCILNQCLCEPANSGQAATGTNCPKNGAKACTRCGPNYTLKDLNVTTKESHCELNKCACVNGVGPKTCSISTQSSCLSCNGNFTLLNQKCDNCKQGYHKLNANTCVDQTCTCLNGIPEIGKNCKEHGKEQCKECINNFSMNKKDHTCRVCKPFHHTLDSQKKNCTHFECKCSHGFAATGNSCRQHGKHICVACEKGYDLDSFDGKCKSKVLCVCNNGKPVEGTKCQASQAHKCESCTVGYRLVGDKCEKNICNCKNGHPISPCIENGNTDCTLCYKGWILNNKKCQANPCTSTQIFDLSQNTCFDLDKEFTYTQGVKIENLKLYQQVYLLNKGNADGQKSTIETFLLQLYKTMATRVQKIDVLKYEIIEARNQTVHINYELKMMLTKTEKPVDYFKKMYKDNGQILSKNSVTASNDKSWCPWETDATTKKITKISACTTEIGQLAKGLEVQQVDNSTSCIISVDKVTNTTVNSCNINEEAVAEVEKVMDTIIKEAEKAPVISKEAAKTVANQFEQIVRATPDSSVAKDQNKAAEIQEKFESILKKTTPGTEITSQDGLITIKVTDKPETAYKDPFTGKETKKEAFTFDTPNIDAVVPKSLLQGMLGSKDCPSPVGFAQVKKAGHLQSKEGKLGGTAIAITTCNDDTVKFPEPVLIKFKAPSTRRRRRDTGASSTAVQQCAYYHATIGVWYPMKTTKVGDDIVCEANHLTYFSLLFRDTTEDSVELTVYDKALTILSIVLMIWSIVFLFHVSGTRRIKKQPILRSQLFLAISLTLMNINFLLGQQFVFPKYDNKEGCAAVAATLQWSICSFFMVTFWANLAMILHHNQGKRVCLNMIQLRRGPASNCMIAVEFLTPYVLAVIAVLISALVTKFVHGDPYFYGGKTDLKTYMNVRSLTSGATMCFVRQLTFWLSIVAPYGATMLFSVGTYLYLVVKIFTTSAQDLNSIQQLVANMKKMILVMFAVGACWLFLIFTIYLDAGIWMDWIFITFKGLQAVSLFISTCGSYYMNKFNMCKQR